MLISSVVHLLVVKFMHSGDLVPFQDFGSLFLQLLMDEQGAAEAHKETEGERGMEAQGSLFVPWKFVT